jgi:hypothetical protein
MHPNTDNTNIIIDSCVYFVFLVTGSGAIIGFESFEIYDQWSQASQFEQ